MSAIPETLTCSEPNSTNDGCFQRIKKGFVQRPMSRGLMIKFILALTIFGLISLIGPLLWVIRIIRTEKDTKTATVFTIQQIDARFQHMIMSWQEAEKACQSIGGHLPSIHNNLHEKQLNSYVGAYHYQWLGGRRFKLLNNQFEWSDRTAWDFENWNSYVKPKSEDEGCIKLAGGSWILDDCMKGFHFLCFKKIRIRYELGEGLQTWDEAKAFCKKRGGTLPSIHNLEQNRELLANTKSSQWLGGQITQGRPFSREKPHFSWTDGSANDFKGWNLNDANIQYFPSQMCITTESREPKMAWSYKPCYERHAFSCALPVKIEQKFNRNFY